MTTAYTGTEPVYVCHIEAIDHPADTWAPYNGNGYALTNLSDGAKLLGWYVEDARYNGPPDYTAYALRLVDLRTRTVMDTIII